MSYVRAYALFLAQFLLKALPLIVGLGILYTCFFPSFSFFMTLEVADSGGIKVSIDGTQPKDVTLKTKTWIEDPTYLVPKISGRINGIRIDPSNYSGTDVLLTKVSIKTSPLYLPAPDETLWAINPDRLKNGSITNLARGPLHGQFRSTADESYFNIPVGQDLSDLLAKKAPHRYSLFVLFCLLVDLGVCAFGVLILVRFFRSHPLRTFLREPLSATKKEQKIKEPFSRKTYAAFIILCIVIVAMSAEVGGYLLLRISYPKYEIIRKLYCGTPVAKSDLPMYLGDPYLNYIAAPHFERWGFEQHNGDGYRGKRVPVKKEGDTTRLLFLGGSTTYSIFVKDPNHTYPAETGIALEQSLRAKKAKSPSVEVINGGMDFATSAEILTHYLFKYKNYSPDVVVIQTGFNDSLSGDFDGYQPDYSHWRQPFPRFDPLTPAAQLLLKSRFLSFIALHLVSYNRPFTDVWLHNRGPDAHWFDSGPPGTVNTVGFENNITSVVREAVANGSGVVLVPDKLATYIGRGGNWEHYLKAHEDILRKVAASNKVTFCPITQEIYNRGRFIDGVHLDPEGEKEKGIFISRCVEDSLR